MLKSVDVNFTMNGLTVERELSCQAKSFVWKNLQDGTYKLNYIYYGHKYPVRKIQIDEEINLIVIYLGFHLDEQGEIKMKKAKNEKWCGDCREVVLCGDLSICKNTTEHFRCVNIIESDICREQEALELIREFESQNIENLEFNENEDKFRLVSYNDKQIGSYNIEDGILELQFDFNSKYIRYFSTRFECKSIEDAKQQTIAVIKSFKEAVEDTSPDFYFRWHSNTDNYYVKYKLNNFNLTFYIKESRLEFQYCDSKINLCIWNLFKCESPLEAQEKSKEIYFSIRKFFYSKKDTINC